MYTGYTLNQLPPLICGPLLRKVTSTSVSVFVATPMAANVKLIIRQAPGGNQAPTVNAPEVASATSQLIQVGSNLYLGVVSCSPQTPLAANQIYGYDVRLTYTVTHQGTTNQFEKGLKEFNLLAGTDSLGYATDALPSFMLPRALPNLNLFHGSCRKIHAEGTDALAALDKVLSTTRNNIAERPQQLILTGDQIYADDVAPAVLRMVSDLGTLLVGSQDYPDDPVGLVDAASGKPMLRRPLLKRGGGYLTSGEGDFHLARLGEFYGMYLLAWSDTLWPGELPTAEHIFSANEDEQKEIVQKVKKTNPEVTNFKATARKARRVFANMPTYMMFDDHEVTDDWFFDQRWRDLVTDASHPASRRVIRNALLAYTVFQHWGNCPDWHRLTAVPPAAVTVPPNANGVVAAATDAYKTGFSETALLTDLGLQSTTATVLFDCNIDFGTHRMSLVNTRTLRGGIVDKQSVTPLTLNTQLGSFLPATSDSRITIVVFPPPFLGIPRVERVQQMAINLGNATTADAEFPSLNPVFIEDVLRRFVDCGPVIVLSGDVHYGFTRVLRYFRRETASWKTGVVVQLCSSALKNTPADVVDRSGAELEAWLAEHATGSKQIALNVLKVRVQGKMENLSSKFYGLLAGRSLKLSDPTNKEATAFHEGYSNAALAWKGNIAVPGEHLAALKISDDAAPGAGDRALADADVGWSYHIEHVFPLASAGFKEVVPVFAGNNIGQLVFRQDTSGIRLKHLLRGAEGNELFYDIDFAIPNANVRPMPA